MIVILQPNFVKMYGVRLYNYTRFILENMREINKTICSTLSFGSSQWSTDISYVIIYAAWRHYYYKIAGKYLSDYYWDAFWRILENIREIMQCLPNSRISVKSTKIKWPVHTAVCSLVAWWTKLVPIYIQGKKEGKLSQGVELCANVFKLVLSYQLKTVTAQ